MSSISAPKLKLKSEVLYSGSGVTSFDLTGLVKDNDNILVTYNTGIVNQSGMITYYDLGSNPVDNIVDYNSAPTAYKLEIGPTNILTAKENTTNQSIREVKRYYYE